MTAKNAGNLLRIHTSEIRKKIGTGSPTINKSKRWSFCDHLLFLDNVKHERKF